MAYRNLLSKKRKFIEFLKTTNSGKPKASDTIKDLGISESTYYRWIKDKNLLKLIEKENETDIDVHIPDVLNILLRKALQGDISAIKLFLQRYDDKKIQKVDKKY